MVRHDRWNIGIVHAPICTLLNKNVAPEVHWLPKPPSGKSLADPFPVIADGKLWVFCEEFDHFLDKGKIVCIELTDKNNPSKPQVAIDLPHHVSYPYVFSYDRSIYCVPETRQAREIALYRAERFPQVWKKVGTLVADFPGVDGTVFQHDGRWWLTSSIGGKYSSLDLYVWHALSPLGPWTPHTANPVKTDTGSTRPAGTPFVHEGSLYRPSQDCSKSYGRRIVLNRIVHLTPTEFAEENVAVIGPLATSEYPHGAHTVSAAGNLTLIDGKRVILSRPAFRSGLLKRILGRNKNLVR